MMTPSGWPDADGLKTEKAGPFYADAGTLPDPVVFDARAMDRVGSLIGFQFRFRISSGILGHELGQP